MPLSHSLADDFLDHLTRKANIAALAGLYIGLSSTTPAADGTNVTEPSTGAYARVEIAPADMESAANSATQNSAEIAFAQATGDWLSQANLTALVLYTAASGGTFLGSKLLAQAKPVLNGDTPKFQIGLLDFVFGGAA